MVYSPNLDQMNQEGVHNSRPLSDFILPFGCPSGSGRTLSRSGLDHIIDLVLRGSVFLALVLAVLGYPSLHTCKVLCWLRTLLSVVKEMVFIKPES